MWSPIGVLALAHLGTTRLAMEREGERDGRAIVAQKGDTSASTLPINNVRSIGLRAARRPQDAECVCLSAPPARAQKSDAADAKNAARGATETQRQKERVGWWYKSAKEQQRRGRGGAGGPLVQNGGVEFWVGGTGRGGGFAGARARDARPTGARSGCFRRGVVVVVVYGEDKQNKAACARWCFGVAVVRGLVVMTQVV